MPFSEGLSWAYLDALGHTLEYSDYALRRRGFLQVTEVAAPIINDEVNIDRKLHSRFENYVFPDGRTGQWWLNNRLTALLRQKGEYWKPMRRDGQWTYVLGALKGMLRGTMPRWNANRIFITLFDSSKDLHKSRAPTPPCLVTLDFKPVKDELTLIATFRAQYTDTKGYGNLLSLALLLLQVSKTTGFAPHRLYSVVHKPILKHSPRVARTLYHRLGRVDEE